MSVLLHFGPPKKDGSASGTSKRRSARINSTETQAANIESQAANEWSMMKKELSPPKSRLLWEKMRDATLPPWNAYRLHHLIHRLLEERGVWKHWNPPQKTSRKDQRSRPKEVCGLLKAQAGNEDLYKHTVTTNLKYFYDEKDWDSLEVVTKCLDDGRKNYEDEKNSKSGGGNGASALPQVIRESEHLSPPGGGQTQEATLPAPAGLSRLRKPAARKIAPHTPDAPNPQGSTEPDAPLKADATPWPEVPENEYDDLEVPGDRDFSPHGLRTTAALILMAVLSGSAALIAPTASTATAAAVSSIHSAAISALASGISVVKASPVLKAAAAAAYSKSAFAVATAMSMQHLSIADLTRTANADLVQQALENARELADAVARYEALSAENETNKAALQSLRAEITKKEIQWKKDVENLKAFYEAEIERIERRAAADLAAADARLEEVEKSAADNLAAAMGRAADRHEMLEPRFKNETEQAVRRAASQALDTIQAERAKLGVEKQEIVENAKAQIEGERKHFEMQMVPLQEYISKLEKHLMKLEPELDQEREKSAAAQDALKKSEGARQDAAAEAEAARKQAAEAEAARNFATKEAKAARKQAAEAEVARNVATTEVESLRKAAVEKEAAKRAEEEERAALSASLAEETKAARTEAKAHEYARQAAEEAKRIHAQEANSALTKLQTDLKKAINKAAEAAHNASYYKKLAERMYRKQNERKVEPSQSAEQGAAGPIGVAEAWAAQQSLRTSASGGGAESSSEHGSFAEYNQLQAEGSNTLQSGQAAISESGIFNAAPTE
jgi:hypothetical protein